MTTFFQQKNMYGLSHVHAEVFSSKIVQLNIFSFRHCVLKMFTYFTLNRIMPSLRIFESIKRMNFCHLIVSLVPTYYRKKAKFVLAVNTQFHGSTHIAQTETIKPDTQNHIAIRLS
ncbi:hypothetical protein SAMN05216326_10121 [Nitrosomonas marina]|uniref:Uncharacterized protein n=1 Tax=Nitrosomonas marina TaxID=917 RepID=A0A1H9Y288_9PROT|nr:hypothetical protein SAMN05216326_10121 [Nitrosomonas marina]